ncbi:MFS transporter [Dictyobacter formicarum]|nr:MFS transporter [Dictyobacter formicarum]
MGRRQTVTPLLVGTFILRANSGAGTIVLGLLLAHIAASSAHQITSVQVGLLPVAFYISELTLAPFMGGLSDRWGRRKFLVLGPVFGLLQAGLLFFTPTHQPLPYLLSLQVLAGLSGAITVPAVLGYLADLTVHNQSRRVRVMSLYELVTSGGIAVGTVMGGLLWFWFGRLSFVFLAASYLLVIWCMWLSPPARQIVSQEKVVETAKRYIVILRMPRLLAFLPAWLCISALVGIWLSSQLTFILSTPVRYPHQLLMGSMSGPGGGRLLSLVLGGVVLFFSLSLLFWAFFLQKVARLRLMFTSIIGVYLACIALFGINHRGASNTGMIYVWLPLLLIGIFAETSFAPAALAYLADISEEAAKDRGMVMGLYSIFLGLGQILGNGLGGMFAHRFGFDGLIYLTVLLALVALLSLFWLFGKDKKYGSSSSTYVRD